jgi:hypothetical protein
MSPFFTNLSLLALQPLPRVAFTLLPAAIGLCAWASLQARSDDRIRAWVQMVTAGLLTLWMALPYPDLPAFSIAGLRITTLFAFGYLLQDWFREAWRSGLDPRWAHRVVMVAVVLCVAALAVSKLP